MEIEDIPTIVAGAPASIIVPGDGDLLTKEFVQTLAAALHLLSLSRLKTTKWLLETLFDWKALGGEIIAPAGRIRIHADLQDRLYTNDLSCAFNSNVKRYRRQLPKRKPQARGLLRLQCFYAAFKIQGIDLTWSVTGQEGE